MKILTTLPSRAAMPRFVARSALAALCAVAAAAAQAETWWTYAARFDGKPASITVDLSIAPKAPMKGFEHLIVTGVDYDMMRSDGMPDAFTISNVAKVTPAILGMLRKVGPTVFAGRFVGAGQVRLYFYVQDATGLEDEVEGVYQQACPVCRSMAETRDDKAWATYSKFLYPTPETRKFYADDLMKLGIPVD